MMQTIVAPISIQSLTTMAKSRFGNLVKGVVDIEKNILVLDADLHADEEALLISKDSKQEALWGINLYPEFFGTDDFIEFDSMINMRPSAGNMTRGVENQDIQHKIRSIIHSLITP